MTTVGALGVGDIVRVVKQRPHAGGVLVDVLGEVGFIHEFFDLKGAAWAGIVTFRINGSTSGGGGIPLDCLAPESAPEWFAAKAKHDAEHEKYMQERRAELERTRRSDVDAEAPVDVVVATPPDRVGRC